MTEPDDRQAVPCCALCGRSGVALTRHHLTPRCRARKAKSKARGGKRRAIRQQAGQTVDLCSACHRMIHAILTERELAQDYDTIAKLRRHPQIACFVAWASRQAPERRVAVRWTRQRRTRRVSRPTNGRPP